MAEIDWSRFESNEKFFRVEVGREYIVGYKFDGIEQSELIVYKKDKDGNRTEEVEKTVPAIRLLIDFLDGVKVEKEQKITSKKAIADIRTYLTEKDSSGVPLLYSRIFKYRVNGSGYQTKHIWLPIRERSDIVKKNPPQK